MEGCLGGGFRLRERHLIALGVFDTGHIPVEVDLVRIHVKIFEEGREIDLGVLHDIAVGRLIHRVDNTEQAARKDTRRGVDNQRGIGGRKQFLGHVLADGEGECFRIVRFDIGSEGFGGDCRPLLQGIANLHILAPGWRLCGCVLTDGNVDFLASGGNGDRAGAVRIAGVLLDGDRHGGSFRGNGNPPLGRVGDRGGPGSLVRCHRALLAASVGREGKLLGGEFEFDIRLFLPSATLIVGLFKGLLAGEQQGRAEQGGEAAEEGRESFHGIVSYGSARR